MNTKESEELKKRLSESESSHWYDQDGCGCHEIEKKTKPGEFRAVNATDAEKMDLVPSVTNLLGRYKNRSGIEKWARGMIYEKLSEDPVRLERMSYCLSHDEEEEFDALCRAIDEEAESEARKAANLGSVFHYFIEESIKAWCSPDGFSLDVASNILKPVVPNIHETAIASFFYMVAEILDKRRRMFPMVDKLLLQEFALSWNMLVTLAARGETCEVPFGVGGKFDLFATLRPKTDPYNNLLRLLSELSSKTAGHAKLYDQMIKRRNKEQDINVLIDWKTRKPTKVKDGIKFPSYPSDSAQLAAYSHGASRAGHRVHVAMNIFIASDAISTTDEKFVVPRNPSDSLEVRIYGVDEIENGLRYMNAAACMWITDQQAALATSQISGGRKKDVFIPYIDEE